MLRFYYNPAYKYTNRTIINVANDNDYTDKNYENVDTVDEINGHIIYQLAAAERMPSYIVDSTPDRSGFNRRWFFSGITQLRSGKCQISLLRDVLSESVYWKDEQAFIEAGTATDYCKYKRWELPYTNTKISQQRFNINGANDKSSFFVFYVNTRDEHNEDEDLEIANTLPNTAGVSHIDYTVSNLNEIPNFAYVGNMIEVFNDINVEFSEVANYDGWQYDWSFNSPSEWPWSVNAVGRNDNPNNCLRTNRTLALGMTNTKIENVFTNTVKNYQQSIAVPNNVNYETTFANAESLYNNYVGKVIYNTSNNKAYTIRCNKATWIESYTPNNATQVALFNNMVNEFGSDRVLSFVGNWCKYILRHIDYSFTLEELGEVASYSFNFTANARRLPKSSVKCVNIVSDSNATDTTIAQCLTSAMENITNTEDTGRIIDVQYLPFRLATGTSANIVINGHNITAQFLDTDDYSFTTDLDDLTNINKETDTIKIVSPSRASQFLFRPYDNNGNMLFQSKVTLKPFASVIYIRPSTQGLLMYDYDDKDCLVINEDCSLSAVTSQWTEYIYSNKNYSNIFEREIQGRAFERSWERRVEQAQAMADVDTARNVTAQKIQTRTGNLPIISSIASAIGANVLPDENYMRMAQTDRQYNEALYQQGLDMSRDLFKYQLDNIKSQPSIPSKITTIDCKLLDGVYLEYYSTNDTELAAINSYYAFNGNRIDNYGTFSAYWGSFIRGRIIRSSHYTQPEIDEINRRLGMGIFTGGN